MSVEEATIHHFLLSLSASATTLLPGHDKPPPKCALAPLIECLSVYQSCRIPHHMRAIARELGIGNCTVQRIVSA